MHCMAYKPLAGLQNVVARSVNDTSVRKTPAKALEVFLRQSKIDDNVVDL